MMIGLSLLLGAMTLFIALLILEIIIRFQRGSSLQRNYTRIATSPNLNLVLYELVAILVTIGLPLYIEESQHPFLIEVWPTVIQRMTIGLMSVVGVLVIHIVRYGRLGLDKRYAQRIYDVAASNAEYDEIPERGLEEAIALVNTLRSNSPAATERGFLEYLSSRDDRLGEIAREKLVAI
ncbi:MAG: hypothetical protein JW779_05805 [Candidatus Thorarchaeota archaeon]|nr:hypothetical protein [Candidatus Thorarchaeota archaeon]